MIAGSFAEFIQRPDSHKIYLADMRILRKSANGTPETYPFYVATEPYFPPPGSVIDYLEAFHGIPTYQRNAQEVFSGRSFPSFGEMILVNDAGTLDPIFSQGWTKDQPIMVRLGGPPSELRYPDFGTVFTGIMGMQTNITDKEITIPVFDDQKKLEIKIPKTSYGAAEYGATFPTGSEGIPKPIIYGEVHNLKPTLIDQVNLKYGVAGHAITQIGTVYDNGINITSHASIDLANATFTLNARPFGVVTCDVKGRSTQAGTYTDRLGGILEAIVQQEAGYAPSKIDQASLRTLKQQRDVRVGIAITEQTSVLESIDKLIAGLLIFYGHNRSGSLDFHKMQKPLNVTPKLIFRGDIEVLEGFRLELSEPKYKVQLSYDPNETVLQENQTIAGSVPMDRISWLVQPSRTIAPENGTVRAFYNYSEAEDPIDTRLLDKSAAQSIASERLTLLAEERKIVRAPFGVQPLQLDMGDVVEFDRSRYNLCGLWAVIGITENYVDNSVELEIFQ